MDQSSRYDALIVGAGIAGSALAYALSTVSRPTGKPFRVALLERSLSEPDRMTGELLQPGGVIALHDLGLEACLENVDDTLLYGYHIYDNGKSAHFPFPKGYHGRSFRHGRFVMNLREAAIKAKGVEVIEASVSQLLEHANRVIGVRATRKRPCSDGSFFADLVFIADGGFSRFRTAVLVSKSKPHTVSHFVGTILEDTILPYPNHGMVALVHGSGPVLLYQIGQKDTRMLVDLKIPLPKDFKVVIRVHDCFHDVDYCIQAHILDHVLPQLPQTLHQSIRIALENKRLRRMPNSFLPPVRQGSPDGKRGVILIGDAWNMRHPLTGGGMTVALHDVVLLRGLLSHVDDLTDWDRIRQILYQWHWRRKPLAATINILSASLHNVCAADSLSSFIPSLPVDLYTIVLR